MVIELTNPEYFIDGRSGASAIVGNDWNQSAGRVAIRTARYTIVAPPEGAQGFALTFRTSGKHDGSHIPIRFYLGEDPDSHAAADNTYAYTGELQLEDDWLTFTAGAEQLLIPGKTYYLWLFPGSKTYGHYTWERAGFISVMETTGAVGDCIVVHNGAAWYGLIHVVHNGAFWICSAFVKLTKNSGLRITSDGEGNVVIMPVGDTLITNEDGNAVINTFGAVPIVDDGNGNVTIL